MMRTYCPYISQVRTSEREKPRLRRDSGVPLWTQLLADVRERLAAGEFDDAFPGELSLAEQYAVSRHTVREALRHLRSEGTVTAARGRKPRLAPVDVEQPLGALSSLFAAVESAGLEQRSTVRALDVRRDGVIAARMLLEESTPLVYLERVRLAGDEPLALDRVWLPAELAEPLLAVDFSRTALYTELLTHCGLRLTGGREQVRAVLSTRGERALLRVPRGVALLAVERTGCLDGRPVEHRHTLVRGDRFAITAQYSGRDVVLSAGAPGHRPPATTSERTPA
jgi:GntR family transcriptional regulator